MILTSESRLPVEHSWHHFFREVFGDAAAMIVVLLLLYVPQQLRQPLVWVVNVNSTIRVLRPSSGLEHHSWPNSPHRV
ncbi:MAG: hypothetical protein ACJ0S4_04205 [Candidatus Rariloculaceae bacterium]